MKFKRNLKSDVGIDLTSLIDVVFILLLFFMLTTSFSRSSNLVINLPSANGQSVTAPPFQIDIQIESSGTYAINGNILTDKKIETLMTNIQSLAAGDSDVPITITADASTSHQSVVTAMDAVARLGFTRINIATIQPEGD
jgi:biopolymer transport protein ExbD